MIGGSVKTSSTRSVSSSNAKFNGGIINVNVDPTRRTLEDVRQQVAQEVGVRAINQAQVLDGVRIGVSLTLSTSDSDARFLQKVADVIAHQLVLGDHLFALATTGFLSRSPIRPSTTSSSPPPPSPPPPPPPPPTGNPLIITGSSPEFVQRAILLTTSKFIGRVKSISVQEHRWLALIDDIGSSSYDEDALWDVVRKATTPSMDPLEPPPGSRGIERILSDVQAVLQRVTPLQAFNELRMPEVGAPTFLVDIRPIAQRERGGTIHGALVVERINLEWMFDPRSLQTRLPIADRYDLRVILFCEEGHASSLAVHSLHQLGLLNATDIIGGYKAWRAAGLPIDLPRARSLVSLEGSLV